MVTKILHLKTCRVQLKDGNKGNKDMHLNTYTGKEESLIRNDLSIKHKIFQGKSETDTARIKKNKRKILTTL